MRRAVIIQLLLAAWAVSAAPVRVIFDTDMCTDCDDVAALAVLHALADRGECEILATVVSAPHPGAAPTVAAINAWYGRPEIPIGAPKANVAKLQASKFADRIAREFPTPVKSTGEVADALEIYRKVLTTQPDGSVTLLTVGYLTNLRNLLQSPGGADLIRRKVRQYVCMGGNFIGNPPADDLKLGNVNFTRDASSAQAVIHGWPGAILFAGREVCSVPSGVEVGACLNETEGDSPVRRAYELYFGGKARDRHVADLASVLVAVRGPREYWEISPKGRMDLHADMTFEWVNDAAGQQQYLLKKRDATGQSNDEFIEAVLTKLLLQPPRRALEP